MLLKDPLFRNHFDQACNWVVNDGLLTQMLVLEILLRLHLLKPARCPLKFKGQPISLIQVQNINLRGTNQINPTVVKFIDQTDKSSSFVLRRTVKLRNRRNEHRGVLPTNSDVIGRTSWPATDIGKLKPDHLLRHTASDNRPPIDVDGRLG